MPHSKSRNRPEYALPVLEGINTAESRYKKDMIVTLPIQDMFPA